MNPEQLFNFRIEFGRPLLVERLCDAFFEGLIWRTSHQDAVALSFDRRSNFLRWVRVLHEGWGDARGWPIYARAYASL